MGAGGVGEGFSGVVIGGRSPAPTGVTPLFGSGTMGGGGVAGITGGAITGGGGLAGCTGCGMIGLRPVLATATVTVASLSSATVLYAFGKRKPGQAEQPAWRELAEALVS